MRINGQTPLKNSKKSNSSDCMHEAMVGREMGEILENKWKVSNAGMGKLQRRVKDILIKPETQGRLFL